MPRVTFSLSVSVDGFLTGPDPGLEHPLGVGGERLHDWGVRLQSWREAHGRPGGESGGDDAVMRETTESVGAYLMGRRMFSGVGGPWGGEPFEGWWGDEPPFGAPVFVLTHHEREPLVKGATTFTFVADGAESALAQAREAAGDEDVVIAGGADVAQQYLTAGAVDDFQIHLVPLLLGDGVRLFDALGSTSIELERDRVVDSPTVTHLRYRVVK